MPPLLLLLLFSCCSFHAVCCGHGMVFTCLRFTIASRTYKAVKSGCNCSSVALPSEIVARSNNCWNHFWNKPLLEPKLVAVSRWTINGPIAAASSGFSLYSLVVQESQFLNFSAISFTFIINWSYHRVVIFHPMFSDILTSVPNAFIDPGSVSLSCCLSLCIAVCSIIKANVAACFPAKQVVHLL